MLQSVKTALCISGTSKQTLTLFSLTMKMGSPADVEQEFLCHLPLAPNVSNIAWEIGTLFYINCHPSFRYKVPLLFLSPDSCYLLPGPEDLLPLPCPCCPHFQVCKIGLEHKQSDLVMVYSCFRGKMKGSREQGPWRNLAKVFMNI